jgi:hypothetical protein
MSEKFKLYSSFKTYFKLTDKKITLKKYYQRFGEKWYKDSKFRLKCILGFLGICKKILKIKK